MKVISILPQNYLSYLEKDLFHMCLGHLIDRPGMEEYTEFYASEADKKKYIIMDNGLIEGEPLPVDELINNALSIGASEIIMPDVLGDKNATLRAIEQAFKIADEIPGFSSLNIMLVPQGETIEEWVDCAGQLICNYSSRKFILGVPKVLCKHNSRGREAALKALVERYPVARHYKCHLLGCHESPLEITMLDAEYQRETIPQIRSVDSAIAFVFTRAGIKMNCSDRPDSKVIDFKGSVIVDKKLLKKNLRIWRNAGDVFEGGIFNGMRRMFY